MDKYKESFIAVKAIQDYQNGKLNDYDLIKLVCAYFDKIKRVEKTNADLQFLKYISNIIGIPHYYDLLDNFSEKEIELTAHSLNTTASLIYESSLYINDQVKIHKFQKNVLAHFETGKFNRYFLSASTSFGKTYLVYEIIRKMQYKNILLIFPTIALLSENLERIISDERYSYFRENYTLHTLSEIKEFGEKNIFIYTPERLLSLIDKNNNEFSYDFAFVDEIYKIDNDYLIDEVSKENERDVSYRIALYYILQKNSDILLAGPYIEFKSRAKNNSIDKFLKENEFNLLNYNNYEIVNKNYHDIKTKSIVEIDEDLIFEFTGTQKTKRLITIVETLYKAKDNCIVYCYGKGSAESFAKKVIKSEILKDYDSSGYSNFIAHLINRFRKDWVLIQALQNGIGIHHGSIPKYIQKEIVKLFNAGLLKVLFSTTTITEGVNTSAKNLIVLHNKKGDKPLKKFDAQNISGRAGRFLQHFSGRVIVLQNDFMKTIESKGEVIKHKNYDINSPKEEIDLFYTSDEYLSDKDKEIKKNIIVEQEKREIPEEIFQQFKVINRSDKITVYDNLKNLDHVGIELILSLISKINYSNNIDFGGFEVMLKIIRPIIKNNNLNKMVDYKIQISNNTSYSVLTYHLYYYLRDGFMGSVGYKLIRGDDINEAIRSTADFIYNTLKYQAVKYFGVFNLMYKLFMSQLTNSKFEDVIGIDNLLVKLEYNALTDKGRIASDYGVPFRVVEYYENDDSSSIRETFDEYERLLFNNVEKIINKS